MKKIELKTLIKIFYTGAIIAIGTCVITYTINLLNTQDDLLSIIGFLTSLACPLLMVYGISKVWLNNKNKQTK